MIDPRIDGLKSGVHADNAAFVNTEPGLPTLANMSTGFVSQAPFRDFTKHLLESFGSLGWIGFSAQLRSYITQQRIYPGDISRPLSSGTVLKRNTSLLPIDRGLQKRIQSCRSADRCPCLPELRVCPR